MEEAKSETIREGLAVVSTLCTTAAFYNPAQEFNRDLSISVARELVKERNAKALELETTEISSEQLEPPAKRKKLQEKKAEKLRILEALAATGLRAIRYGKEVSGVGRVLANDFSEAAVDVMRENVIANDLQDVVFPSFQDAVIVMQEHKRIDKRFHVVDLDPYGSPAQFLDAAVQCVEDEGILMVTCTDVAVLCGNAPETCHAKYGSVSLKSRCCHEMALRILLRSLEAHANRYSRFIQPLLSLSVDFYIRVFVRLSTGALKTKDSVCKLAHVFQCVGCHSISLQPLASKAEDGKSLKFSPASPIVDSVCGHCSSRQKIGGPIWSDPIHDFDFVRGLLDSIKNAPEDARLGNHSRLIGVLSVISEELADVPLYYDYAELCHVVRCRVPQLSQFRSALLHAGYRVSISHAKPTSIKSDAPMEVVWDVVRCLARSQDVSADKLDGSPPGKTILSQAPRLEANFENHPLAEAKTRMEGLLRFQDNKGKNFGPKPKAKGSVHSVQSGAYSNLDVPNRDSAMSQDTHNTVQT